MRAFVVVLRSCIDLQSKIAVNGRLAGRRGGIQFKLHSRLGPSSVNHRPPFTSEKLGLLNIHGHGATPLILVEESVL